ncbi:DnaJ-domain-containing protein [Cylindrobasidium torrendii FP15055 ss-10]|uniref:DnaJ-domain-containing protein n=1 Tax=Cylindrobasidium torrendii FP15055 ss-10 TaxID=1314674 RepID=A0A0D7BAK6_9AGAR|nr:DnaJ-domain-containing protein [Cylindrobasidium torrendii FP15055 ss-10]
MWLIFRLVWWIIKWTFIIVLSLLGLMVFYVVCGVCFNPEPRRSPRNSKARNAGEQSYYEILGISEDASPDDIKRARKQQSLAHHPDKNPDDQEGAKARFQKIQEAYETLIDDEKRRNYVHEVEKEEEPEIPSSKPRRGFFDGGPKFAYIYEEYIEKYPLGSQEPGITAPPLIETIQSIATMTDPNDLLLLIDLFRCVAHDEMRLARRPLRADQYPLYGGPSDLWNNAEYEYTGRPYGTEVGKFYRFWPNFKSKRTFEQEIPSATEDDLPDARQRKYFNKAIKASRMKEKEFLEEVVQKLATLLEGVDPRVDAHEELSASMGRFRGSGGSHKKSGSGNKKKKNGTTW